MNHSVSFIELHEHKGKAWRKHATKTMPRAVCHCCVVLWRPFRIGCWVALGLVSLNVIGWSIYSAGDSKKKKKKNKSRFGNEKIYRFFCCVIFTVCNTFLSLKKKQNQTKLIILLQQQPAKWFIPSPAMKETISIERYLDAWSEKEQPVARPWKRTIKNLSIVKSRQNQKPYWWIQSAPNPLIRLHSCGKSTAHHGVFYSFARNERNNLNQKLIRCLLRGKKPNLSIVKSCQHPKKPYWWVQSATNQLIRLHSCKKSVLLLWKQHCIVTASVFDATLQVGTTC